MTALQSGTDQTIAQAHHLAYHDMLTGLPNRSLFNDNADQAILRGTRDKLAVSHEDLSPGEAAPVSAATSSAGSARRSRLPSVR